MKILVTGGAGYIGSHVVQMLGESREEVVSYDNLSNSRREAVLCGEFVHADLDDVPTLTQVFAENDFDAVIHLAASIYPDESSQQPLKYYKNNVCNTLNLLQQCQRCAVKYFIFSSTAAVYQGTDKMITEETPTNPLSPYGWSKLMGEQVLMDAAKVSGMKYAILRYFNVAGADAATRIGEAGKVAKHLVKVACRAAVGAIDGISIFGTDYDTPDGTCIRDYIHVTDLADIHITALTALVQGSDNLLLNCGYGHGYSVKEVLATTRRIADVEFPLRNADRLPVDSPYLVAANTRLKDTLNWQPRFDNLDTIIGTALKWERKLHNTS